MLSFTVTLSFLLVSPPDAPKIHARTPARIAQGAVVIRTAAQLAKLRGADADKASADVARLLKVQSIDWKKQMLIVIAGGVQRTGGYSVEAKSLEVKAGKLIVHWKLKTPAPGAFVTQALTNPALTILVDRFEGDVVFDPKAPPAGKGKKRQE
ncbi:MAG: protease complex subunit PrcB family protein [Planctomycetes bacterium]|nr:protease complex subunit PrcB family protein [Planctomycetota bacterium]